jgi:hypothetical protein
VYKHLSTYLCCSVQLAIYSLFYILLSHTTFCTRAMYSTYIRSISKSWRIHKQLHAILTNHTINYNTNPAAPVKTYQFICTSQCDKLFMLHTQPSDLRDNKHYYIKSQVLTTQQCDSASFRLLFLSTQHSDKRCQNRMQLNHHWKNSNTTNGSQI